MHIPQVAYDAALKAFLDRPNVPMRDRIEIAVDVAVETAEDKADPNEGASVCHACGGKLPKEGE